MRSTYAVWVVLAVGAAPVAFGAGPGGTCQCNVSVIAGATGMTLTSGAARGPCGREMATGKVAAAQTTARAMAARGGAGPVAGAAPGAAPESVPVDVQFSEYTPDPTINVGDTVVWSFNDSGTTHTVTSVQGSAEVFNSGFRSSGTFQHTFTTPGVFTYYCTLHAIDNGDGSADGMVGTITVNAVPEPAVGVVAVVGLWCGRRRGRGKGE